MNQFRIVSNQFGYPMYAAEGDLPWSDVATDARVYDERDDRGTKLKYWKALASVNGLDPEAVQIEEIGGAA